MDTTGAIGNAWSEGGAEPVRWPQSGQAVAGRAPHRHSLAAQAPIVCHHRSRMEGIDEVSRIERYVLIEKDREASTAVILRRLADLVEELEARTDGDIQSIQFLGEPGHAFARPESGTSRTRAIAVEFWLDDE